MRTHNKRDARRHWFNIIQDIVNQKQAAKVQVFDGKKTRQVYVDLFTASLMTQVHDSLNSVNQEKFKALSFITAHTVTMKLARPRLVTALG